MGNIINKQTNFINLVPVYHAGITPYYTQEYKVPYKVNSKPTNKIDI